LYNGPPKLRRDDVQRRVVVEANVSGRDMGGLVVEIDLPTDYSVLFGEQFENQRRA
jgi:heavy metal efflux system protein